MIAEHKSDLVTIHQVIFRPIVNFNEELFKLLLYNDVFFSKGNNKK